MAISKGGTIELKGDKPKINKRMIFLASKASNNINQIARKLNSSHRGGVVSEKTYVDILNKLITIESAYIKAMNKC